VLGPSFYQDQVPDVIEKILNIYLTHRQSEELFIDTYDRVGITPFKEAIYAKAD
jgi:sulfite reductase (NADPH) hemoprotein beta-component